MSDGCVVWPSADHDDDDDDDADADDVRSDSSRCERRSPSSAEPQAQSRRRPSTDPTR